MSMIDDEEVADRRMHYISSAPGNNFARSNKLARKREMKLQNIRSEDINSNSSSENHWSNSENDSSYSASNSQSNKSMSLNYTFKEKRRRKARNGKYLNREFSFKDKGEIKRNLFIKINPKSNVAVVLPKVWRENSNRIEQNNLDEEIESDEEEYLEANRRVPCHIGYSAASFLVK